MLQGFLTMQNDNFRVILWLYDKTTGSSSCLLSLEGNGGSTHGLGRL